MQRFSVLYRLVLTNFLRLFGGFSIFHSISLNFFHINNIILVIKIADTFLNVVVLWHPLSIILSCFLVLAGAHAVFSKKNSV